MTWPQAVAIVGFMASVAAIVWAAAWASARTNVAIEQYRPRSPTWTVETRTEEAGPAPQPPRES